MAKFDPLFIYLFIQQTFTVKYSEIQTETRQSPCLHETSNLTFTNGVSQTPSVL